MLMKMQPRVSGLQRAPVYRDPVLAAVDATADQSSVLQHLDVLGDVVLGHRERLPHLTDRQLARLAQERDHLAASRIGQAVKGAVQLLLRADFAPSVAHANALRSARR